MTVRRIMIITAYVGLLLSATRWCEFTKESSNFGNALSCLLLTGMVELSTAVLLSLPIIGRNGLLSRLDSVSGFTYITLFVMFTLAYVVAVVVVSTVLIVLLLSLYA